MSRGGWPIVAVSSRDAGRRERFRRLVPGVRAFSEANAVLDEVELVILAVPDDALAGIAEELRLYSGQALVHTSGLLGPEVLAPARAAAGAAPAGVLDSADFGGGSFSSAINSPYLEATFLQRMVQKAHGFNREMNG